MYLVTLITGTLMVLLLYEKPLVLSAKPILDQPEIKKRAYSEGANFIPHEEEIVEALVRQADGQTHGIQGIDDDEIEIDLAPPPHHVTDSKPLETPNKRDEITDKRNIEQLGELEFAEFKDPKAKPSFRAKDVPVVEVKRAPAGTPVFSGAGAVTQDVTNTMFVATITACVVAAVFGLVVAGVVFRKIHKQHEAAREATYPQYGGTGPAIEKKAKKSPTASGDANLAYSAQLHHFNQTKQKIISTETSQCDTRGQESDDSEGEGEEGDYSVYECPGLAPTGDIEVSNPLFENASPKNKDAPESISKATDGD